MAESFIARSIVEYIVAKCAKSGNEPIQFSIPVKDYDRNVVTAILEKVAVASTHKDHISIKVAKQAIEYWSESERQATEDFFVRHSSWKDSDGNLTRYRNTIQDNELLIIVGIDCVEDTASLEHIISCSSTVLWNYILKRSFRSWILEANNGVDNSKAEALLKAALQYTDLQHIDTYLCDIVDNSTGYIDNDIGSNLWKLGLMAIINFARIDSFSKIIKFSVEFLHGNYSLDYRFVSNASAKFDELLNAYEEGDDKAAFLENCCSPFDTPKEYLSACKACLYNTISEVEKEKLAKTDAYVLYKKILGYKIKKAKVTKLKVIPVSGTPLEAVLCALWRTFQEYLQSNYGDSDSPCRVNKILISLETVVNNSIDESTPEINQREEVISRFIKPYFGGLDECLEAVASDLADSDLNILTPDVALISDFSRSTDFKLKIAPTSMNSINFVVRFEVENDEPGISLEFKLAFPPGHPFSYSYAFIRQQEGKCDEFRNDPIPVFIMEKYLEYSKKADDEADAFFELEALNNNDGLSTVVKDLTEGISISDGNLGNLIACLSRKYNEYISAFCNDGFYSAVKKKGEDFYKSYSDLLNYISSSENILVSYSTLCKRLLRAYWVIDSWHGVDAEANNSFSSGILTILHPAVAEMANEQINYQIDQFTKSLINVINNKKANKMRQIWDLMIDYSKIQTPIPFTGAEMPKASGSYYLFNVGDINSTRNNSEPMTVVESYSFDDETDVSTAELTRMSDESMLLHRLFKDYFHSNSFAYDGVRIAILMPVNIQAVMSAVVDMIPNIVFEYDNTGNQHAVVPFRLDLDFYSTPEDEGRINLWISKLQTYWKEKSLVDEKFAKTSLMVGFQLFSKIDDFDFAGKSADIIILYESRNASIWKNHNLHSSILYEVPAMRKAITQKFPMVEELLPKKSADDILRHRLVSNRQFEACSAYFRYSRAVLNTKSIDKDKDVVVMEEYDFSSWLKLFDKCLDHCERIITIGSEMDKDLILCGRNSGADKPVVIVGFGSGIGANANLNYTVSSRLLNLKSIKTRLAESFSNMYFNSRKNPSDWLPVINQLYEDSNRMADLSLIKAFGCHSFYSHDFFGYAMIRHLYKQRKAMCDVMISLDSYRHWFKNMDSKIRADLLWIVADVKKDDSGRNIFSIKASVLESKVGYDILGNYLQHAAEQAITTCAYLKKRFTPALGGNLEYDSKYWWMQLHRLIASNSYMNDEDSPKCIEAFENLAEGIFEIEWDKHVFGFDTQDGRYSRAELIDENAEDSVVAEIINCNDVSTLMAKPFDGSLDSLTAVNLGSIPINLSIASSQEKAEYKQREDILEDIQSENQTIDLPKDKSEQEIETEDSSNDEDIDVFVDANSPEALSPEEPEPEPTEFKLDDNQAITSGLNLSEKPLEQFGKMPEIVFGPAESEKETDSACLDNLRILLGKNYRGKEIFWDYGINLGMQNRHMLVLGSSGSGKSYAIKMILAELARVHLPSLIIDYTDGFDEEGMANISSLTRPQYSLIRSKLPMNPFSNYDGTDTYLIANRVAGVFTQVWKNLGARQKNVLVDTIDKGLRSFDVFTFNDLLDLLKQRATDKSDPDKNIASSLASNISLLCRIDPFVPQKDDAPFWKKLFTPTDDGKEINVLQLKSIPRDTSRIIIEFILWDLYYYLVSIGSDDRTPHTIVLDEIQNLGVADVESPVGKYFTEGRKKGIGLIAATQAISELGGKSSQALSIMMNAATILFFKPVPNETMQMADFLVSLDRRRSKSEWADCLASLTRGQCIVCSVGKNTPAEIIKIASLEERGLANG